MNQVFMNWLASSGAEPFFFKGRYGIQTVIKIKKNDNFYYLFCQENYHQEPVSKDYKFEYAGLYCIKDSQIYDAGGCLFEIGGGEEILKAATAGALKNNLQQSVREKVEAAIGNDKNNLILTLIKKLL